MLRQNIRKLQEKKNERNSLSPGCGQLARCCCRLISMADAIQNVTTNDGSRSLTYFCSFINHQTAFHDRLHRLARVSAGCGFFQTKKSRPSCRPQSIRFHAPPLYRLVLLERTSVPSFCLAEFLIIGHKFTRRRQNITNNKFAPSVKYEPCFLPRINAKFNPAARLFLDVYFSWKSMNKSLLVSSCNRRWRWWLTCRIRPPWF